jgi:hypothetical protein
MTRRLPALIVGLLLAAAEPLAAQEHGAAHPAAVNVVPSIVPPIVVSPGAVKTKPTEHGKPIAPAKPAQHAKTAEHGKPVEHAKAADAAKAVEPGKLVEHGKPVEKAPKSLPPARVAEAVAEALKEAAAAAARRSARTPVVIRVRRSASTAAAPTRKQQHYEVRWPSQRMVVRWPEPDGDRVKLSWPEQAPAPAPVRTEAAVTDLLF